MLREERVIQMTRMAMDEEKNARLYLPIVNVTGKDYLSWNGIVSFFVGTLTYLVFYAAVVVVLLQSVFSEITTLLIVLLGLLGIIGYLLYLFTYMTASRQYAKKKFERGKKELRHRISDWNRLEEIYQTEEESKSPTVSLSELASLHQLDIPVEPKEPDGEDEDAQKPQIVVVEEEPRQMMSAIERLQRIQNG